MIHDLLDDLEAPVEEYDPDSVAPLVDFPKEQRKVLILCPQSSPCLEALHHLWEWILTPEKNFYTRNEALLWELPTCPPARQRTLIDQAVDAIRPERLIFVHTRLRTTLRGTQPEEPALITLSNFEIEEKDIPVCPMRTPDQVDQWGAALCTIAEERSLEGACVLPVQDGVEAHNRSLRALTSLNEICGLGTAKSIQALVPSPVRFGMAIYQ